jgi:hypothetical protein
MQFSETARKPVQRQKALCTKGHPTCLQFYVSLRNVVKRLGIVTFNQRVLGSSPRRLTKIIE